MLNNQSKTEEAEMLENERTRGRNITWYKHDRYLKSCNGYHREYKWSLCSLKIHWQSNLEGQNGCFL